MTTYSVIDICNGVQSLPHSETRRHHTTGIASVLPIFSMSVSDSREDMVAVNLLLLKNSRLNGGSVVTSHQI